VTDDQRIEMVHGQMDHQFMHFVKVLQRLTKRTTVVLFMKSMVSGYVAEQEEGSYEADVV
jgi:hypothetical protein